MRLFIYKKEGRLNQRQNIINKINELQELITDSKEETTKAELAEYLMKVNKLQALLKTIKEKISNKKQSLYFLQINI